MSNRDRIHKSPVKRHTGAKHTHDYPVAGRKNPRPEEGTVNPKYGRKVDWVEEGKHLQTDRGYGGGSRAENPEAEYEQPRPRNNYDDAESVYPPSQR